MLTANQLHKQSKIDIEFQDFLAKMKEGFGENFMDLVNEGKVKLQEIQKALGLEITPEEKKVTQERPEPKKVQRGANPKVNVRKVTKSVSGSATGPKCSSCEANKKNASGDKTKNNALRNVLIFASLGAVVYWAVKNRK